MISKHIAFNKPYFSGNELENIKIALDSKKISGDGMFTKKCQQLLVDRYGFKKVLLTSSCTDALEMASLLTEIKQGDEVIAPAYGFVSTVNPFVLRGAKIVFADSYAESPGIDAEAIEKLITKATKAIVVIHYAGIACDMEKIMSIASKYNLLVIEDAAQAIDSYYKGRALGSIGHVGCFSFHETKNIQCGEGGCIVLNENNYLKRSEILWEKGTNRSAFFRGEIDKYGWVDIGSSFLPSDITAAFLFAQLESIDLIQAKRIALWNKYKDSLLQLEQDGRIKLPRIPSYSTNNGHIFYIVTNTGSERTQLIQYLKEHGINAVFHYLSLNKSPFQKDQLNLNPTPNSDNYTECLLRLPLYHDLSEQDQDHIIHSIQAFFKRSNTN